MFELIAVVLLEGDCHFAIMGGDAHGVEKSEAVRSDGLSGFRPSSFCSRHNVNVPPPQKMGGTNESDSEPYPFSSGRPARFDCLRKG